MADLEKLGRPLHCSVNTRLTKGGGAVVSLGLRAPPLIRPLRECHRPLVSWNCAILVVWESR